MYLSPVQFLCLYVYHEQLSEGKAKKSNNGKNKFPVQICVFLVKLTPARNLSFITFHGLIEKNKNREGESTPWRKDHITNCL